MHDSQHECLQSTILPGISLPLLCLICEWSLPSHAKWTPHASLTTTLIRKVEIHPRCCQEWHSPSKGTAVFSQVCLQHVWVKIRTWCSVSVPWPAELLEVVNNIRRIKEAVGRTVLTFVSLSAALEIISSVFVQSIAILRAWKNCYVHGGVWLPTESLL